MPPETISLAEAELRSTSTISVAVVADVALGGVVLVGSGDAAARVDDELPLRDEPARDAHRLIEQAAGIAAQVEDQALHAPGP